MLHIDSSQLSYIISRLFSTFALLVSFFFWDDCWESGPHSWPLCGVFLGSFWSSFRLAFVPQISQPASAFCTVQLLLSTSLQQVRSIYRHLDKSAFLRSENILNLLNGIPFLSILCKGRDGHLERLLDIHIRKVSIHTLPILQFQYILRIWFGGSHDPQVAWLFSCNSPCSILQAFLRKMGLDRRSMKRCYLYCRQHIPVLPYWAMSVQ